MTSDVFIRGFFFGLFPMMKGSENFSKSLQNSSAIKLRLIKKSAFYKALFFDGEENQFPSGGGVAEIFSAGGKSQTGWFPRWFAGSSGRTNMITCTLE